MDFLFPIAFLRWYW